MSNATNMEAIMPRIRLAWIERQAREAGTIKRKDVATAFGISLAQVSSDLQTLQAIAPGCLDYDLKAKCYRWSGRELALAPPAPIADFIRWHGKS